MGHTMNSVKWRWRTQRTEELKDLSVNWKIFIYFWNFGREQNYSTASEKKYLIKKRKKQGEKNKILQNNYVQRRGNFVSDVWTIQQNRGKSEIDNTKVAIIKKEKENDQQSPTNKKQIKACLIVALVTKDGKGWVVGVTLKINMKKLTMR